MNNKLNLVAENLVIGEITIGKMSLELEYNADVEEYKAFADAITKALNVATTPTFEVFKPKAGPYPSIPEEQTATPIGETKKGKLCYKLSPPQPHFNGPVEFVYIQRANADSNFTFVCKTNADLTEEGPIIYEKTSDWTEIEMLDELGYTVVGR